MYRTGSLIKADKEAFWNKNRTLAPPKPPTTQAINRKSVKLGFKPFLFTSEDVTNQATRKDTNTITEKEETLTSPILNNSGYISIIFSEH